jgi:hypothetical protein
MRSHKSLPETVAPAKAGCCISSGSNSPMSNLRSNSTSAEAARTDRASASALSAANDDEAKCEGVQAHELTNAISTTASVTANVCVIEHDMKSFTRCAATRGRDGSQYSSYIARPFGGVG